MAMDALDRWMNESAATDTVTGSWIDLSTRTPYCGIPVLVRINGGAATSTAKTLTLSIQGGTDGSNSSQTLFTKAYTISTTANSSNFEEVIDNFVSSYRYVRVVATFSAAISTGTEILVGPCTGSEI